MVGDNRSGTSDGHSILYVFGEDAGRRREIRKKSTLRNPQRDHGKVIPVNDQVSEISVGRHLNLLTPI